MALSIERTDTKKWQDVVNLILGAWLFISPWVLGFAPAAKVAGITAAAWNAWIFGIVIGVFAIAALIKARPWEEWINLIAGAWVFVSPWVLGFYSGHPLVLWNSLIVGALVFALSIWDLNTNPEMAGRHV
jgi:SPW repeat